MAPHHLHAASAAGVDSRLHDPADRLFDAMAATGLKVRRVEDALVVSDDHGRLWIVASIGHLRVLADNLGVTQ